MTSQRDNASEPSDPLNGRPTDASKPATVPDGEVTGTYPGALPPGPAGAPPDGPRAEAPPDPARTGAYPGPPPPAPGTANDAAVTVTVPPGQRPQPGPPIGQPADPFETTAPDGGAPGDGSATRAYAGGRPTALLPGTPGRYLLKRFHARGGMGEIWVAEDQAIDRVVALKRMREEHDHLLGRFMLEAQITGQLEHPSVVPIHDLATGADGQPYYVMKFVHGRTLREAVAAYHAARGTEDEPREVQWLRLLQAFVALCQAIAYAHSRGVIHRDIKPDNVMIGPYGETLVLDWGLAKVLGQARGAAEETGVRPSYSGMSTQTMDGSALGSPAYMAPEMAEGRPELIDKASDVYLLGATLYEILTGTAPRHGKNLTELLSLARETPPPSPRKLAPRLPRALEAICLKAMAHRKEDRYAGALVLAEDMQRYLAGEPVLAYPEPLHERAWRWVKRHRRGLATVAAVMVVATAAAFGFKKLRESELGRLAEQRRVAELQRQDEARHQVATFRRLADETRYYIASSDPVAEQAPYFDPARGEATGKAALAVADAWGPGLDGLPLAEEREPVRADLYDLLLMMAENRSRQQATPAMVHEALALLDRAAGMRTPSRGYYRLRAYWLRTEGEDAEARQERQRAEDAATPATALDHFLLGEQYRTQPLRLDMDPAGEKGQPFNRDMLGRAVEQYRAALRLEPSHYWSHFQLARCYMALGKYTEAVEALGACVALKPQSAWGYSTRGFTLALLQRYSEAEADLNRALELDPEALPARLNRGVVYREEGKPKEALADFAAVLAAPADRRLLEAAYYRGQLYLQRGDLDLARADFDRVVKERPSFRPAYLFRAQARLAQGEGARALEDLNAYLAEDGRFDAASGKALEKRGRQLRHLIPRLPRTVQKQTLQLALADLQKAADRPGGSPALFLDLGGVLETLGRADDALQAYSRGLKQSSADTKLLTARGWLYAGLNRMDQAQRDFAAAVQADPTFSEAHTGLGYVEARQKVTDAASREADLALLYGSRDYLMLHNVACIHAALADGKDSHAREHQDVALALLRRAVELWKRGGAGPNEIDLIKKEPAFKPSLERRPEFKELVQEKAP